MRYCILCLILLYCITAKAQFAIIKDPDGFANVRKEKNIKSEIVGKVNTGTIVLYSDDDDDNIHDWKWMAYSPNHLMIYQNGVTNINSQQKYLQGFIHKSRIISIYDLPNATLKKGVGYILHNNQNKNNDTISFSIKVRPFNSKSHKIDKSDDNCVNCTKMFVDKIDGKKPWGVDGDLPTKEIYNISLTINRKAIIVPVESYNDLYEPGLNIEVHYDDQKNIYLYMPGNSDGAGGYDVVWVVKDRKLIKRYVDSIG